jgi:malonyl-CoA O-methyltransferase
MARLGADQRPEYEELDVVEGYDKWASTYDQDPNPLIALEEGLTLDMIGDVQGLRVLDLGCGTGRYCVLLARRGAQVVGVDPSKGMLECARRKMTPVSLFEVRQETIDKAGLPGRSFDLIISALALGHLPELGPALAEAARLLKEGGRLVISDIHPYWPVSGHDYTEFFAGGREYRMPIYPHLVEEYWRLCRELGLYFEDIREPRIDNRLIASFPSLKDYEGIPLAIVLGLRKR